MKKLVAILVATAFAMPAFALDSKAPAKKPATTKKEVKKHKKVEGTKVPDAPKAAPKAPAKKK